MSSNLENDGLVGLQNDGLVGLQNDGLVGLENDGLVGLENCPSKAKMDRQYLRQFRHACCQVSHRGGEDRPWPKAGKESPR